MDPVIPILDFEGRLSDGVQTLDGTGDGLAQPTDPPLLVFTGARARDSEGALRPLLPHTLVVPASQWQAQIGLRLYF